MSPESWPPRESANENTTEDLEYSQAPIAEQIEQSARVERTELSELELESWGVARALKDFQGVVRFASRETPNRDLILRKIDEILTLIPVWGEDDEHQYEKERLDFQRKTGRDIE